MKRGQDDISQAKRETECGLSFEKFTDVEEGDVVQCYTITVTKQPIEWNWGFWLATLFFFTVKIIFLGQINMKNLCKYLVIVDNAHKSTGKLGMLLWFVVD